MDARTKAALTKRRLAGIKVTAKPPKATLAIGSSKVGGDPDLSADVAWPVASRVKDAAKIEIPLAFVAQIALGRVTRHDVDGVLPKDGLLSFFVLDTVRVSLSAGWSKDEAKAVDRARVLYSPRGAKLARRARPEAMPASHVGKERELAFAKVETWPQIEGLVIGDAGAEAIVRLGKADWRAWAEDAPKPPRTAMLGHPYGCEYPIGRDPDARLLLSLDVKVGLPWIGRNGFLFFFAPATAIAERAFDRAQHKEW